MIKSDRFWWAYVKGVQHPMIVEVWGSSRVYIPGEAGHRHVDDDGVQLIERVTHETGNFDVKREV